MICTPAFSPWPTEIKARNIKKQVLKWKIWKYLLLGHQWENITESIDINVNRSFFFTKLSKRTFRGRNCTWEQELDLEFEFIVFASGPQEGKTQFKLGDYSRLWTEKVLRNFLSEFFLSWNLPPEELPELLNLLPDEPNLLFRSPLFRSPRFSENLLSNFLPSRRSLPSLFRHWPCQPKGLKQHF